MLLVCLRRGVGLLSGAFTAVTAIVAVSIAPVAAHADPAGAETFTLKPFAGGYAHPIRFVTPPGGGGPLYVVQQEGAVLPLSADPKDRDPLIDLSTELSGGSGEGGLLDIAFHPQYADNGLVYVTYTTKTRTIELRLSEFTATRGHVDTGGERKMIRSIIQEYTNLGGSLAFGPDGMLYIGIGDGSGPSDPQDRGQNRGDLFGSVLRIGTEKPAGKQEYTTPADNPFVKNDIGNHDIYAYGFRDPRSMTWDLATKTLYAGDTGIGLEQEIDEIKPAGNYGWAVFDGKQCMRMRFECMDKAYVAPVLSYLKETGTAIALGPIYAGAKHPSLTGMLLYADGHTGKVWGLKRENGSTSANPLLLSSGRSLSAVGVDPTGTIYVSDYDKGEIFELTPNSPTPPK